MEIGKKQIETIRRTAFFVALLPIVGMAVFFAFTAWNNLSGKIFTSSYLAICLMGSFYLNAFVLMRPNVENLPFSLTAKKIVAFVLILTIVNLLIQFGSRGLLTNKDFFSPMLFGYYFVLFLAIAFDKELTFFLGLNGVLFSIAGLAIINNQPLVSILLFLSSLLNFGKIMLGKGYFKKRETLIVLGSAILVSVSTAWIFYSIATNALQSIGG